MFDFDNPEKVEQYDDDLADVKKHDDSPEEEKEIPDYLFDYDTLKEVRKYYHNLQEVKTHHDNPKEVKEIPDYLFDYDDPKQVKKILEILNQEKKAKEAEARQMERRCKKLFQIRKKHRPKGEGWKQKTYLEATEELHKCLGDRAIAGYHMSRIDADIKFITYRLEGEKNGRIGLQRCRLSLPNSKDAFLHRLLSFLDGVCDPVLSQTLMKTATARSQ